MECDADKSKKWRSTDAHEETKLLQPTRSKKPLAYAYGPTE